MTPDPLAPILEHDVWRLRRDPDRSVRVDTVLKATVKVTHNPSGRTASLKRSTLFRDYQLAQRDHGLVTVGAHRVHIDVLRDSTPETLTGVLEGVTADDLYAWAEDAGAEHSLPWKRPAKRRRRPTPKKES